MKKIVVVNRNIGKEESVKAEKSLKKEINFLKEDNKDLEVSYFKMPQDIEDFCMEDYMEKFKTELKTADVMLLGVF